MIPSEEDPRPDVPRDVVGAPERAGRKCPPSERASLTNLALRHVSQKQAPARGGAMVVHMGERPPKPARGRPGRCLPTGIAALDEILAGSNKSRSSGANIPTDIGRKRPPHGMVPRGTVAEGDNILVGITMPAPWELWDRLGRTGALSEGGLSGPGASESPPVPVCGTDAAARDTSQGG
jgi:hypothetical protein